MIFGCGLVAAATIPPVLVEPSDVVVLNLKEILNWMLYAADIGKKWLSINWDNKLIASLR